jgi:hypothetical protein
MCALAEIWSPAVIRGRSKRRQPAVKYRWRCSLTLTARSMMDYRFQRGVPVLKENRLGRGGADPRVLCPRPEAARVREWRLPRGICLAEFRTPAPPALLVTRVSNCCWI